MKLLLTVLVFLLFISTFAIGQESMMMSPPKEAEEGVPMMTDSPGAMMMSVERLVDFIDLEDAKLRAAVGPTVLFFYADWCPVCVADKKELESRVDELGNITVLVVNYDKNRPLRRKYGVTYQHTFVQIDSEGEKVELWNGGGLEGLHENVVYEEIK